MFKLAVLKLNFNLDLKLDFNFWIYINFLWYLFAEIENICPFNDIQPLMKRQISKIFPIAVSSMVRGGGV